MLGKKNIVALIPARSGSTRIKNKNIKLFCGKPLIYWTIKCAKKSKFIDKVFVTTNSKYIGKLSKKYGATVPFLRSQKISKNNSKNDDYVKEFIKKTKENFDIIVILQPTSPLRLRKDIDKGIKIFLKNKANLLIGCFEINKKSINLLSSKKKIKDLVIKHSSVINKNLSHRKNIYARNGSMFIFEKNFFLKKNTFECKKFLINQIPYKRSIDIDYINEFREAENYFKQNNKN